MNNQKQYFLKIHGDESPQFCIETNVLNEADNWKFKFKVKSNNQYLWKSHSNNPDPKKNWMLWEADVAEVFLVTDIETKEYLELQVAPNGAGLQLKIIRPRSCYYTPLDLEWNYYSKLDNNIWYAEILIPKNYFKDKTNLIGNMFCCLGTDKREYYALYSDFEIPCDFHRTKFFNQLF